VSGYSLQKLVIHCKNPVFNCKGYNDMNYFFSFRVNIVL
jgi:hypothetical protein